MNEVTQILNRIEAGDSSATADLLPLVYDELKRLASNKLRQETKQTQMLEATALVHEAYLRLAGSSTMRWENRAHFFAAAAEAMRRILIDQIRASRRQKRGGQQRVLSLESVGTVTQERGDELIQLNDALEVLEAEDPEKAQLVKLKFFVGLTTEGAAEILGMPLRTAERSWAFARAWLYRQMSDDSEQE